MKTARIVLAVLALALAPALPLRADASARLEKFKKELATFNAFSKEQECKAAENPMAGIAMIRNLVERLKDVKTEGLPEDLKSGFEQFVGTLSKMGDILKDWPEKVEDIEPYIQKRLAEDPKFMQAMEDRIAALDKEMQPAIQKLEELGKKYALEGLDKLAPGAETAAVPEDTARRQAPAAK